MHIDGYSTGGWAIVPSPYTKRKDGEEKGPPTTDKGNEKSLETIYTSETGDEKISWGWGWSDATTGWREISPGVRESITFYNGEWGWLSREELWEARQGPFNRTAP